MGLADFQGITKRCPLKLEKTEEVGELCSFTLSNLTDPISLDLLECEDSTGPTLAAS